MRRRLKSRDDSRRLIEEISRARVSSKSEDARAKREKSSTSAGRRFQVRSHNEEVRTVIENKLRVLWFLMWSEMRENLLTHPPP